MGHDFQSTVRGSIFLLESDGDPIIWIKSMQDKEGEFALESHIGELTILSRQYYMMNGKISMIGEMLDSLADEYHQLAFKIKNDLDYTQNKEQINHKIDFLVTLLNKVDSISAENERRYYRELMDSESMTSNLVWKEYKKYEKK